MKFIFEFEGNSTLPPQTQQDLCENNKRFLQAKIPLNKIGLIFAKFVRHNELADINVVGASLSEPHSNVENVRWSMREEPRRKTGLQHTTVVWYGGSCTNKHDKLTDTSIQVLWHCKNIRLHVLTFHIRLVRSTMHEQ